MSLTAAAAFAFLGFQKKLSLKAVILGEITCLVLFQLRGAFQPLPKDIPLRPEEDTLNLPTLDNPEEQEALFKQLVRALPPTSNIKKSLYSGELFTITLKDADKELSRKMIELAPERTSIIMNYTEFGDDELLLLDAIKSAG